MKQRVVFYQAGSVGLNTIKSSVGLKCGHVLEMTSKSSNPNEQILYVWDDEEDGEIDCNECDK